MEERIRHTFIEMARKYEETLNTFYPGKGRCGFNESNQIRIFLSAYEKLYVNTVTWQELSAGSNNQRIDGFILDRDLNGIIYIEAKRLNSENKCREMVHDYERLSNPGFRESLRHTDFKNPMAHGIDECSEHILLLCDVWNENTELQRWIANWHNKPSKGHSNSYNPILERMASLPSDGVSLMLSSPIKPLGCNSEYYLAGLSISIKEQIYKGCPNLKTEGETIKYHNAMAKKPHNSVLEFIQNNNSDLFSKIENAFADAKGLDFCSIKQSDMCLLSPAKALEYSGDEGDKYFKLWMKGNTIVFCTWANTLVDSSFKYKRSGTDKRDASKLLANPSFVSGADSAHASELPECDSVWMLPFNAFKAK